MTNTISPSAESAAIQANADSKKPHIVIIGGGFGGLHVAQKLRKANARITLIDKRNFHLFQPLLYQVATGTLSPSDIATPLRHELRQQKNTTILETTVRNIDPDQKRIFCDGVEIDYDWLVVATGVKHAYFGNDHWREFAPGLKTVEHALTIRSKILSAFEAAEVETDPEKRKALLNFVVIGAGPTGVELAGTIGELAHKTMRGNFRNFKPEDAQVLLVEGADQVLPAYPDDLREAAQKLLNKLGVTVMTNCLVTDVNADGVMIKNVADDAPDNDGFYSAKTVLWAAGVKVSSFGRQLAESLACETDRTGRIMVNDQLQIPNHPDVYVLGDLAHFETSEGNTLPGVAPVAAQQGAYLGKALLKRLDDQTVKAFKYWDKGHMAVIGNNAAVAHIGGWHTKGWLAWYVWALVHIFYLIEFDQKVMVAVRWVLKYFRRKRGVRLITAAETSFQNSRLLPAVNADSRNDTSEHKEN